MMGDLERARELFAEAFPEFYADDVARPETFPLFENVWSDPEFQSVMAKISADLVLRREAWNSGETAREIEEELEVRGLTI